MNSVDPSKKPRKKSVGKEVIKSHKTLPRTGKIKLPKTITLLKQPNIITLMSYDFKLTNIRVLISVIEKVQDSIEENLRGVPVQQTSLFADDEKSINLDIQYSEIGVEPYQYGEVKASLKELVSRPVEIDTINPWTGEPSWKLSSLMKAYFPKKYGRSFSVEIDKDIAQKMIEVGSGYTKFIKEVAMKTNSKYTVRIYMLICSWKDKGGFQIEYAKFRRWLMLEEKYPIYKKLQEKIIQPVYEELFEKADCWFEMSAVFESKTDKNPQKLVFKVIRASLSEKEKELLETQKKNIRDLCLRYLTMNEKQVNEIEKNVTITNYQSVIHKVTFLMEHIRKHYQEISSVSDYSFTAIMNVFDVINVEGEELETGQQI